MTIPKFIKQDEMARSFREAIEKVITRKASSRPAMVFESSCMAQCWRRLLYNANGVDVEKKLSYMDLKNAEYAQKKWVDILSTVPKVTIVDTNVEVSDCNFNLNGVIDVVFRLDSEIRLLHIHLLTQEEFVRVFDKGPFKKHVIEAMVNAWLIEKGESLLMYENGATNEYVVFHVSVFLPIIETVKSQCRKLLDSMLKNRIPERPYNKAAEECSQCEFANHCWNG
jgi:hypothetical protein